MSFYTFVTDATPPDEVITVQGVYCRKVIVYEQDQAGTADYVVHQPTDSSAAVTRPAGAKTEFVPPDSAPYFLNGQVVAYISAATGSLNMVQEEQ